MGFLESYKRLDNLCKDLFQSETGLATYISNMEQTNIPRFQPDNFDSDYKNLKHYRWIRNQIVHVNNVDEVHICNENDIRWIEQFHQRILSQTDPLAQYHKALTASKRQPSKPKRTEAPVKYPVTDKRTVHKAIGVRTAVILIVAAILAVVLFLWVFELNI